MYKKYLLIISLSVLSFGNTIDFNSALEMTLKNNKSLKAKKLSIDEAKANLNIADAQNFGKLDFKQTIARSNNAMNVFGMKLGSREADFNAFGFSTFLANQTNPDLLNLQPDDLNNPDARTNFETKIEYSVPLFTGYKLQSAKKMSELQVDATSSTFLHDKKKISLEVLKAYNGAVASKYFIDATTKAKEATSSFVYYASEMFKEGYVTSIDVKQAKVYDMKINSMLLEAQNKYSLSIAYLRFLTNDKKINDVRDFQNIHYNKDYFIAKKQNALIKRDDYQAMIFNTKTMKSKIDFEKADNYPMIGAHLEYGFNDNQLNNISSTKDYYTAAVGLTYNIFDGSSTTNKIQKAKINYEKTKNYLEYMEDGIKLEIEKAQLTLKTKESILEEKLKAQNLEEEILLQSEEMYKNQLLKMNDLILQQASAQKSRAEAIMAKYEKTIAAAKLRLALGLEIHTITQEKNLEYKKQ